MTLHEFAIACGAEPKWVQNASRSLARGLEYTVAEARRLGLVRMLNAELGIPVERADEIAGRVLKSRASSLRTPRNDGVLSLAVDLDRYLSDFSVRLSRAREQYQPRRRGRRPTRSTALERAREYGLDLTLLESNLAIEPGARIQRLSQNMDFVKAIRGGARKRTS